MRWLVCLVIQGHGFRSQDAVSNLRNGKSDGAGRLLHRQRSFAARSAGESAPLYPNLFLASKPPWYSAPVRSAFDAMDVDSKCGSNPEVFYLGTAPLYDANGSLSDGLALVGNQVNRTESFFDSVFGAGNYTLHTVWHTGAGLSKRNASGPVNGTTTTQADVIRDLNASCVVFVDGGNTYALQYFLARAATRDVTNALKARVQAGAAYIGASAGAIVSSPTAETANFKNWKDEGDSLLDWQNSTGLTCKWNAGALSIVGLGLPSNDSVRDQVVCNATSFVNGQPTPCLGLDGLGMAPIGVFPHLRSTNALYFAVGALLSKEHQPVVALPNDVAVVQAANSSSGMRLFVPGCSASVLVSTPLNVSLAGNVSRIPSASSGSTSVPAVTIAGTTWAVESPQCSQGSRTVSVCECFPTWPARSASSHLEDQLPPCSSCTASLPGNAEVTLDFETVRSAVDSTRPRLDSAGEHRLIVLRVHATSRGAAAGLALALAAVLLAGA